ncbi:MAG: thioredoxin [Prolixibacteraceae bacterium]|nr:thioredoxin [Prolixibacteraceae bacterium]
MAIAVNDSNFEEIVLKSEKPVVVDFGAEWCGPCKMIAPIIEELSKDYEGRVVVGKVDVDESSEVAGKYGIRNIPTVLFFKGGEIVDKNVGGTTKKVLAAKIDAML